MALAFWLFHSLNKNKGYVNSYAYARSREEWNKLNPIIGRNNRWTEERKQKHSESMKGKTVYKMTDEIRQKIRKTLKLKYSSGELISSFRYNQPSKHITEDTKKENIFSTKR